MSTNQRQKSASSSPATPSTSSSTSSSTALAPSIITSSPQKRASQSNNGVVGVGRAADANVSMQSHSASSTSSSSSIRKPALDGRKSLSAFPLHSSSPTRVTRTVAPSHSTSSLALLKVSEGNSGSTQSNIIQVNDRVSKSSALGDVNNSSSNSNCAANSNVAETCENNAVGKLFPKELFGKLNGESETELQQGSTLTMPEKGKNGTDKLSDAFNMMSHGKQNDEKAFSGLFQPIKSDNDMQEKVSSSFPSTHENKSTLQFTPERISPTSNEIYNKSHEMPSSNFAFGPTQSLNSLESFTPTVSSLHKPIILPSNISKQRKNSGYKAGDSRGSSHYESPTHKDLTERMNSTFSKKMLSSSNLLDGIDERGHVFVVHGDLTKLACDAWMLPTDDKMHIESYWGLKDSVEVGSKPEDWSNTGARIMRVENFRAGLSPPWLVNVGGMKLPKCALCKDSTAVMHCKQDDVDLCVRCDETVHSANDIVAAHSRAFCEGIEWYIRGAKLFFKTVYLHLKDKKPLHRRAKHLVGLPLVGTGRGGASQATGGVVAQLMPEMYDAAQEFGYDICIVLNDRSKFAAIQVLRHRFNKAWDLLDKDLCLEAKRLADAARKGDLVLFLGAGISAGAGLPTWAELIDELAQQAGMTTEEREMLKTMNNLDSARIVELHLGGSQKLAEAVAKRVQVQLCTISSCLLAGLPVKEVVTTNYDQMFETASRDAGLQVAVLPYVAASNCDRWVLKMHGDASHPEDIVLTREDYLRYATRRSALQGIVQSLLITRHMLFVGFSLNDDNFHRVVDEVRRAIRSTTESQTTKVTRFGTSLSLIRNHIVDMLWKDDLHMIPMIDEQKARNLSSSQPKSLSFGEDTTVTEATNDTKEVRANSINGGEFDSENHSLTRNSSSSSVSAMTPASEGGLSRRESDNSSSSDKHTDQKSLSASHSVLSLDCTYKDGPKADQAVASSKNGGYEKLNHSKLSRMQEDHQISSDFKASMPATALTAIPSESSPLKPKRNMIAISARRMEIFLDYLSFEASTTAAYLLKPQFDALLTEPQRSLRNCMTDFLRNIPDIAKTAEEWYIVRSMVSALGGEKLVEYIDSKKPSDKGSNESPPVNAENIKDQTISNSYSPGPSIFMREKWIHSTSSYHQ